MFFSAGQKYKKIVSTAKGKHVLTRPDWSMPLYIPVPMARK